MMSGEWIVVGGCGFLGDALVRRLSLAGRRVAVLDVLSGPGSTARRQAQIEDRLPVGVACFSTSNADAVRGFIAAHREAEALAFVSGQVSMLTSLEDPRADMEANFLGAFNVLEALRAEQFAGPAILASSNKVYGDLLGAVSAEGLTRFCSQDFDESTGLDLRTPYGCSKGAADQYWRDYHRTYGLRTIVLRHSSMYGPGQIGEVGHGWVAWFIREALAGSAKIKISGNGKQVRDLLHIDDAVAAYLAAAEHADACAGRAFNVGGGRSNSLSILELVSLLRERRGWQPKIECGPWRLSDQRSFVSGNTAFTGATGWAPRISARDGIGALL